MQQRRLAIAGTLAVAVHAVIAAFHGAAHSELGIQMSPAENAFIDSVIVAAPIVAAVGLWTRFASAAASLLAVAMAGSLLFGVYHHYIAISPDHVAHLPAGSAQGVFRATAVLLVLSEAAGIVIGASGTLRLQRGST